VVENCRVTSVRALTDADWPAVLGVYAEGIESGNATFETEVPRPEMLDARWLPGHRWVADLAGTVVGWAAARPVSTRSCYAGVAETAVHVADRFQGRGVGRALLQHLVVTADEAGLWTLQTSIFPENIASLELHYAVGFRMVGVRERIAQHRGVWRDTVLVERRRPH
jgi:L-amino acid N-acyltransferase YncA